MIVTNRNNLPESFVRASESSTETKDGTIRVTELIGPPQIRTLTKKHWKDIEVDAIDNIWSLLGTSVHYMLENFVGEGDLSEEQLKIKIGSKILSGKPDLLGKDGILSDYKVTSVWSYVFGDKPEWEQQLNVYRWMFAQDKKYPVIDRLQIVAIFRDWSMGKTFDKDYPQTPVCTIDIPLWSLDKAEQFIKERLELHERGEKTFIPCTAKERWQRDTTFAVKEKDKKRAIRVFETMEEATQFKGTKPNYFVEQREGQSVRCESYCRVSKFCPQFSKIKANA